MICDKKKQHSRICTHHIQQIIYIKVLRCHVYVYLFALFVIRQTKVHLL